MSSIFGIVGPVFLTILIGYLAWRFGRISADGLRGLNNFVLMLALPALLFEEATSSGGLGATVAVSVAYFTACIPVYLLAVLVATPTGANAFILAGRYATGMKWSGAMVLLASGFSLLTLSLIISLFVL